MKNAGTLVAKTEPVHNITEFANLQSIVAERTQTSLWRIVARNKQNWPTELPMSMDGFVDWARRATGSELTSMRSINLNVAERRVTVVVLVNESFTA